MIRLFLLLLSLNISSDLLEREDINDFIDMAVENSDLDRDEIINYLLDAESSKRAVQARNNQPEVKATWDDYLSKRVTITRINNGVKFLNQHLDILEAVEKDYGVSKFYITSIIGMETNYGSYYGSYNPLDAIFTRAFEPNSNFWQKELIELFILSKRYNLDPKKIKSSWSGAIGLGQFIPSSYNAYGVDYDLNGFVDLLGSREDGIASVANYLRANGWIPGKEAAIQINFSGSFEDLNEDQINKLDLPFKLNNFRTKIYSSDLREAGFKFDEEYSSMISPILVRQKDSTKLYLGFDNFRVITKYNRSSKYALAVHQLALEISNKFYE
tara:strand:+ start:2906 stop:3889 length:984 start_codon:yes stop_codon:yes gene_type:complete